MAISRRDLLLGIGAVSVTASAGSFAPTGGRSPLRVGTVTHLRSSTNPIRLDQNENAFAPSPRVVASLKEDLAPANRYPDVAIEMLTTQIAKFHRVASNQIILGAGSTAIMRVCTAAFLGPGKQFVMAEPGFDQVAQYARASGAEVKVVPLTRNYSHDLPAMRKQIAGATGLVYICNPNNPTGTMTPRKEIEEFIKGLPQTVWTIIDEAYHPYANANSRERSFIDQPTANLRVIVTRTFSNIYGLAGLRVGYAITSADSAQRINAYSPGFDLSMDALHAAGRAIEDQDYVRRMIAENADARQEFVNQAQARALKPIESQANFVLLYIDGCLEVAEHFQRHNVLIAANFPGLAQSIRVTLGKPSDMETFWRVLDMKPSLRPI